MLQCSYQDKKRILQHNLNHSLRESRLTRVMVSNQEFLLGLTILFFSTTLSYYRRSGFSFHSITQISLGHSRSLRFTGITRREYGVYILIILTRPHPRYPSAPCKTLSETQQSGWEIILQVSLCCVSKKSKGKGSTFPKLTKELKKNGE